MNGAPGLLLLLMMGCASPGPPHAPSLHIPETVSGLTAERRGDAVVVKFEAPVRSTEKELLGAPVAASLCRAVGDGRCVATSSFPKKLTVAGPVEWVDVLPAELAAGAARKLTYRVETFNPAGRSVGPSEPVWAAAGTGPEVVVGLRAEGSGEGAVLRWTPGAVADGEVLVERERMNVPVAVKPAKKPVSVLKSAGGKKKKGGGFAKASVSPAGMATDSNTVWLRADEAQSEDRGGMVDATARADEEYRYTAVRRRTLTVDGRKLEMRSEASAAVTLKLKDVYPPAAPQGLLAARFPQDAGIAVDLVWQPNAETDVAGYNVYRQAVAVESGGPRAAAVKLNEKPVALPSFHDATVARGTGYLYSVTAVDSKGNESAASAAVDVAATP